MYDFDFLKAIQDQILIYRDFPLPAVICNKEFRVYWSNDLARQFFPHATTTEGLHQALGEFSMDKLFAEAVRAGNCTIQEVFPLSGVNMSITPILRDGEPIGMTLIFLRADNQFDKKTYYQTSRMAGALSDNIRDVVNDVFSALDLAALKSDFLNAGWLKQGLDSVAYNNYRMLRIASNITEYASYQSGLLGLNPQLVDLTALLRELAEAALPITEQTGIPVTFTLPDEAVILPLDAEKFERAFFNVLHNALYYTKPDNAVEVSLSVDREKEEAVVKVTDRGIGIPKAILTDVTRPYFVHDRAGGTRHGIGLGLTVVRLIAEAHDGRLSISSHKGKTTVEMIFPAGVSATQPLPLGQQVPRFHPIDRFSTVYTGLCDTIISPYRAADTFLDSMRAR